MKSIDGHDIYVRVTNSNGESHIREHRVWDSNKFLSELAEQGKKPEKAADRFTVAMVTKADYQKERN